MGNARITGTEHSDGNLRDKAVRLFTYLKEVCQLRFVVVRDCRNYEQLLWFHDVPHEPECFCIAWNGSEASELWIEVRRGAEPACPPVPAVCKDWVNPADLANSVQTPTLREWVLTPARQGEPPSRVELSQQPDVRAKWEDYLITRWEPWAKEHRRWKSVQQVYGNLFSIYQHQKRLGESFELRIGLGLLSWQTPTGERIYRHIVAGQAAINFDANRGVISVLAAAEGIKLALEHDMLEPSQLPTPEQHQAVEDGVQANAETPWDRNLIEPLLRSWVHAMNQQGHYEDSLQPPTVSSTIPHVTFAPALILRRRTAKTLVKLLNDIAANIEQDGQIPFGVQRLCSIVDEMVPDSQDEPAETTTAPQPSDTETYFPLPANDEQRRIAQRLSTGRGVLVQGPPGTGKSHTIANLICHLLAKGKRVLVTSQTPRALKVLKDKIPQELASLCVSILGNDTLALKNMENSVLGITERHHDWEGGGRERNAQNLRRLEERLYTGRKRLAEIETRLCQLRELETYLHSIAGGAYQGTAAYIAQKLVVDRERFGWLPDSVEEKRELPLQAASFLTVLKLLRGLAPARCVELSRPFIAITEIPDVDAFVRVTTEERAAKEVCCTHSQREASPIYKALVQCGRKERGVALEKLQALQTAVGNIRRRPLAWIPNAIHGVLSDQDRPWRELLHATTTALKNLRERARTAHDRQLQLPDQIERHQILADARDLHTHLANGGNLGFLFLRSAVVRRTLYLTKTIRVNGRLCATMETLSELAEHLDLEMRIEAVWGHWEGIAEKISGPLPRQVSELEECQEALELVVGLIPFLDDAKAAVKNLHGLSEPGWHDDKALVDLIADLQAVAARDVLLDFDVKLAPVVHALGCAEIKPNAHPVNAVLSRAVADRDTKTYSDAWNRLRQLSEDKQQLDTREIILRSINRIAPRLAAMLVEEFETPTWEDRLAHIEEAWNWSRANAWFHGFHRDQDAEKLEAEAKVLRDRMLPRTMAELAAEKAWWHCFQRMTQRQRMHLAAWSAAMKKVTRTGRWAEKNRRDAQKSLEECREAIPAWIMPFYQVVNTVSAIPDAFDVVIVDEASQSGIDALALFYLAKQIVIVGDDEQISPEAVGVDREDWMILAEKLIHDIPFNGRLNDPQTSLFSLGTIHFPGRTVLREHFRCVPEIIRFSNDLCYMATPLVPLRQHPPDRLEPIVVRHVEEGFREGGTGYARNKPEAEALVEAIVQCTTDPRYFCAKDELHPDGKLTFGVISLQGEEQAKLINQLLLQRLTPEEIEQRELICGDAYAFQGDERDVMFLSMVAAPNQRFAALVKQSDKQRFNVAASRGRDQVWLFHTVTLNELNPDDMRYKLLAYYTNPAAQPIGKPDWEKCESDFEREVGRIICGKDYRLIPQYEPSGPGGYRIDFVIEGLKSRLAVECDGPYHDDPEQIGRDMVRQRQLERCKWVFWRVSASSFYFDRDKAMASLWRRLDELGICPLTPTQSTETLEIPAQTDRSPEPIAITTGTSSIPSTSLGVVSPPQNDIMVQTAPPTKAVVGISDRLAASLSYSLTRQIKRARTDATREDICDAVLAVLDAEGSMEREGLVRKVTRALELPSNHQKRVEAAIDSLHAAGQVSLGITDVSPVQNRRPR